MESNEKDLLVAILRAVEGGRKVLGFRVQEIFIIASVLLAVLAFYLRTNDAIERLVAVGEFTKGFIINSDNYHASVLGTQFYQGKPTDPSYDAIGVRNFLKRGVRHESTFEST